MGPDHPLANRKHLGIRDLAGQKLIFPRGEQFDRQQIIWALEHSEKPEFIDANPTLYDMILQQLLPLKAMMLCAEPHAPVLNQNVLTLVLFYTDLLRSQIFLLIKKGTVLSEAARQILTYLLAAWHFPPL